MFSKLYRPPKRKLSEELTQPPEKRQDIKPDNVWWITLRRLFTFDDIALIRKTTGLSKSLRSLEQKLFSEKYQLSFDQTSALLSVLGGYNTFISGSAGTGKTYLIGTIQKLLSRYRKTALTSTTGVTAVQLGCRTIHKFSGIGIRKWPIDRRLLTKIGTDKEVVSRWKGINTLIIDEISMFSPEQFELCARLHRFIKHVYHYFTGLQIITIGDFMQLPPINAEYLYKSQIWKDLQFRNHFLITPWRQQNDILFDILQEVRFGRLSFASVQRLKSCVLKCPNKKTAVYAFSRRDRTKAMNDKKFLQIDHPPKTYLAVDKRYQTKNGKRGKVLPIRPLDIKKLDNTMMVSKILDLKESCRVMAVKNDEDKQYANGSTGTIIEMYRRSVLVLFDGHEYPTNVGQVEFELWDNEEIFVRTQLPFILAYAVTIHKTQGMTIDHLHGDLSAGTMFAPGQAYVFLSRCRSLEGLCLKGFHESSIFADQATVEYYESMFGK